MTGPNDWTLESDVSLSPRVLVLAGGLSHERDVSLRSGRRVAEALRDAGCSVVERDVDAGLLDQVPAVAAYLLPSFGGEGGFEILQGTGQGNAAERRWSAVME